MSDLNCIILAAGLGTRLKSARPKVLHEAAGRSLVAHVAACAGALQPAHTCIVAGPGMEALESEAEGLVEPLSLAIQQQRKGTGHAVMMARAALADRAGTTLVLYGDVPLIQPDTLGELVAAVSDDTPLAVLAFDAADPTGYGRLILDHNGRLSAIREHLDASPEERAITLCNSGIIAIDNGLLWRLVDRLGADNAKGEYYLTDIVALARADGAAVAHVVCAQEEVLGVNDRAQLARVEALFQSRLRAAAMAAGATLIAPETVFLSHDTAIGRDVIIEPHVVIGPGVSIGEGARINAFCHIHAATIAAGASIGPFARIRPGANIGEGAKIGNFVETKNATIAPGAKVNHLSYVGDATVGAGANIGAGTITCNYDGHAKHHTTIGARAFIGSNSALVAPVSIGEDAYVGSGSVITGDVEPGALAVARARQSNKPGWARRLARKRAKTSK